MIRNHELFFDEVVLGGTIDALKHAKENKLPVVVYKPEPPHRFSKHYCGGEYGRLSFLLSLAGQVPLSDKIDNIRYEHDGPLRVSTKNAFSVALHFNKLIVFSDAGVMGFPPPDGKTNNMYEVVDWINVRSGMSHAHERIESTSDFVKWLHFYPTERLDGHHPNKKDAAAISYMTKDQLEDPEWSDTYVRFKALDMMKAAGIKGQSCGDSNYALKIETALREVYPLGKNIYKSTDRLEFVYD